MTTILLSALSAHPALGFLLFACLVVLLHIPVRYERRRDRRGHIHTVWQSALYVYQYGPTHERLRYTGLLHLQRAILRLLRSAWALLCGDMLRHLVDELRLRIGL